MVEGRQDAPAFVLDQGAALGDLRHRFGQPFQALALRLQLGELGVDARDAFDQAGALVDQHGK